MACTHAAGGWACQDRALVSRRRRGGTALTALALRGVSRVLCLGAHCDDIEIGVGGTLLSWLATTPGLEVDWVVLSSDRARRRETERAAERFLHGAGRTTVTVHGFRDGFLPYQGGAVKEAFERLKQRCTPDVIFTPARHDAHQDHRLVSELTWNTFRDHAILEYEIPKYDGDFATPNVFVPLDETVCREKVQHLVECFKTQASRPWFSPDVFLALMRLRGMEARSATRYAEAFHARKLVLELGGSAS